MTFNQLGFKPFEANGVAMLIRGMGKFGDLIVEPGKSAKLVSHAGSELALDPTPTKLNNLIKNLNQ